MARFVQQYTIGDHGTESNALAQLGGRFLVHGADVEVVEGERPGTVVIIEFPGTAEARDWYASAAYQEILPLRTGSIDGAAILVEGVGPGYHPRATAAMLRHRAADIST